MFNHADIWERVADEAPEWDAIIHGDLVRSWGEFEGRASRLAGRFARADVGHGDKVALYLHNGPEYLEVEFAAFKQRAVPCNVNYRYLEAELHYLLENADATVVVADEELVGRVLAVRANLPRLRLILQVGGDSVPDGVERYEDVIAAASPAPRIRRDLTDQWFLYTGGTTGHPKAVMWSHGTLISYMAAEFAAVDQPLPDTVDDVWRAIVGQRELGRVHRSLAAAPLMHGTSSIVGKRTLALGGAAATLPSRSFDADLLFSEVQRHRLSSISIVGDAFAKPMVAALDQAAAAGEAYDLSSLQRISSSGLIWSAETKSSLLRHVDVTLLDTLGASEGVGFGLQVTRRDSPPEEKKTARFTLGPNAAVLREDGTPVDPGSGEVGKLAVGGALPDGYYKDPEKTAATYPVIDGIRWAIPGDFASVEMDGTITLLGRGSVSINSGGEKIFPEEVEEALKQHPAVVDANAVGVPDEKWGQAVVGVVELDPAAAADDEGIEAEIIATVKQHIAAYKAPKALVRVERLLRNSNGKSDYRWASTVAREALGIGSD